MKTPLVSILCLCYNQSIFIEESLESIKSQTYNNFEILICDDASSDNSVEVIENWIEKNPQLAIKFIKHEQNKGICKSLNDVFNTSSGKYVQILALDDLLISDKLERHVEILENSSEKDVMVFSDALMIDDYSKLYQNRFIAFHINYLRIESGNFYNQLLHSNFIPAMSVLLKSSYVKKIGGWDEALKFEDYDMWLRLSKEYDFIFDEIPSCMYRIHENNTHKNRDFLLSSYFNIFYKHQENQIAKRRLFSIMEKKYLSKALNNEHFLYYKVYKAETVLDKLIKANKWVYFYKIISFIDKRRKK